MAMNACTLCAIFLVGDGRFFSDHGPEGERCAVPWTGRSLQHVPDQGNWSHGSVLLNERERERETLRGGERERERERERETEVGEPTVSFSLALSSLYRYRL